MSTTKPLLPCPHCGAKVIQTGRGGKCAYCEKQLPIITRPPSDRDGLSGDEIGGARSAAMVCISCGKPAESEWCSEPCNTDLRDSNNRVTSELLRLRREVGELREEVGRLRTRGGIARSLIPVAKVEKFHHRCKELGV